MKKYNDKIYDLLSQESVKEISSSVEIYNHRKSGARVLFALSDDDNKVFNISFKTPPEDDTGVAHIMEHSVLCGSRKYPVKEPFVELMKGSLNTFLNAMTYPDKTIYPVASRNHKDFRNLADVYLDAVFFPTLSKDAFEQEGWHYDLLEGDMQFKGVVFNEMKGVFSSPESYLDYHLNKVLFAGSSYGYESGGYPEAIPDLTYDDYLKFHKEKYHPANSWIIIYGDVERDFWLDYLDKEYLSNFEQPDFKLPSIIKEESFSKPREVICKYPAASDSEGASSLISLSFLTGDIMDVEHNFAMGVLDAILIGSQGSPLKKALLESGLADDTLDYGYGNETLQTTWSVGLRDTKSENKQAFVDLVFSELKKYSEEGLPKKMVEAAMNTCEFQLREANYGSYPKGLVYSINIMNQWLYGDNPTAGLKYEELLANLKSKVMAGGYFESLIKEVFLENPQYVVAVCEADGSMEKEILEKESERLAQFAKTLTAEDKSSLLERNEYLMAMQGEPDTEDALATIPHVSKDDIKREIKPIPTDEITLNGVPAFYHDLKTQGIIYMQLSFNCDGVALEDYRWLALMNSLLLKVGTKDTPYDDFLQEISCHTGGMTSTVNIFSSQKGEEKFGCHLWLQTKVMKEKVSNLVEILQSVFQHIDFSDTKRIKELVGSMVSRAKTNLQNNGDRTVRSYLGAALSKAGYLGNYISGPEYFEFLKSIQKALDEDEESVISRITGIRDRLFRKGNMLINLTASGDVGDLAKSALEEVVLFLPEGKSEFVRLDFDLKQKHTGLQAPGGVQYVAKGVNLKKLGYVDHGSFDLINQLLSTGYLWEKIRVQGGAYGCYLTFDRLNGALMLASYRDPNLEKTLDVFAGIADFLENLEISESGFEKLLIGTFGRLDAPLTPSQKGKLAFNRRLTGVNYKELNLLRSELLDSTIDDLKSYAKYFRSLSDKGTVCVHGSEGRLQESANLFDEIFKVGE